MNSSESPLENGEDEEEVWLFWRDANKETRSKSIRELAQDAKEGQKEDQDVLSYYRYWVDRRVCDFCSRVAYHIFPLILSCSGTN